MENQSQILLNFYQGLARLDKLNHRTSECPRASTQRIPTKIDIRPTSSMKEKCIRSQTSMKINSNQLQDLRQCNIFLTLETGLHTNTKKKSKTFRKKWGKMKTGESKQSQGTSLLTKSPQSKPKCSNTRNTLKILTKGNSNWKRGKDRFKRAKFPLIILHSSQWVMETVF